MNTAEISYETAGMLAQITRDYIGNKAELKPYFNFSPDLSGLKKSLDERKKMPVDRERLVERLRSQYSAGQNPHSETIDNIERLKHSNTFTVTTGHQLNLFTGPLYFVWKILSTVNLTRELKKAYPDYDFVPVYWPAGEDHDFEEVNHTFINKKKYTWNTDQGGAVGRFSTDGLDAVLNNLSTDLKNMLADKQPLEDLQNAFSASNYGAAVRNLVNKWFGKYGLVIVNGDDPELKKAMIPVAERDLTENKANILIEQTAEKLDELGYKKQVTPRDINLFYLSEGKRSRIVQNGDTYSVLGTDFRFSQNEIIEELHAHPDRFSPNVALRPMYQETVLPNIAYIGGGAEVAYWLQLKAAFEEYRVFYPAVLPRNSVLVLTERARKKQDQLNLSTDDIFQPEHLLAKRVVTQTTDKILHFQEEKAELKAVFAKIKERMAETDETLRASAQAAEVKHLHYINNLEKKLLRAEKKNNKVVLDRIKALKEEIAPGGTPQERKENIFTLYTAFGTDIIEEVRRKLEPLNFTLTVFYEE